MVNPHVSPAEASFITTGVAEDVRGDGRTRTQYRSMVIETGLLVNASGSCRLQLAGTDVLVGVKVDVGEPDADAPGEGRFLCSVDCTRAAGLASSDASGDDLSTMLTQLLSRRFTPTALPSVDFSQLGIIAGEQCWVVAIDAVVLAMAGNVVDALVLATKAALATTRVPGIKLVELADGEMDFEVLDEPSAAKPIAGIEDMPLCVTVNKIGARHVLDANFLEEQVASARLHIFATPAGVVAHVHKAGNGAIEPSLLRDMTSAGRKMATVLHHRLAETLRRDALLAENAKKAGVPYKKFGFFV